MTLVFSIFAALGGLIFGSFLNVCVSRLPRHESIVVPRSRCPRCLAPILNRDNIPLLSWLLLRGRCRSCGGRIPIRYPLIEAATAALFLLCFLDFGLIFQGLAAAILCWLLLGLAAMDAETMLLPDALTLPGIVMGILYSAVAGGGGSFSWRGAGESLARAAAAGACILLIRWLYWLARRQDGIGLGDAKLLAMLAAWLGAWQTLLALFLAVVCAAVYGLALIVRRGSDAMPGRGATKIPLGAFLGAAGIVVTFQGARILNWYLSLFL